MNRIIKYIPVLLLIPFLFASCAGDKIRPQKDSGKPGIVHFSLASSLRASGKEGRVLPTPALDRERNIDKLYAVVFRTSSGLHYKTIACTKTASGSDTYEFDNEKSGDFYFFLVANPDATLEAALKAGPTTPTDLGKLIATQTPGEDAQANNFLMTSERVNVAVKSKQSTTIPDPIKLVRLAARFDFYNKIEGLVIDKITFGKRYTSSHLFAQVNQMDGLTSTTDKVYEGTLFENGALKATIYGYETDIRNETFFTIEATYKGVKLKPEYVRLENFVIKRNHLYNIILHELGGAVNPDDDPHHTFGKLKYEIKVADWEEMGSVGISEDDVQRPLIVEYDAELPNAPYMNPYLKDSQKNIYTATKEATEVMLHVHTFVREGSLSFAESYTPEAGVTLTEVGRSHKDPATGQITRTYKLALPMQSSYVSISKLNGAGKLATPEFKDIPLVAKNFSGMTSKEFTVKHGRPKMPVEFLATAPLNPDGTGFATIGNKVSEIGYFKHKDEAVPRFANCEIGGVNYHMPTDMGELGSLVARADRNGFLIGEGNTVHESKTSAWEYILFPNWYNLQASGKTIRPVVLASDFRTDKANKVTYAIRFKPANNTIFGKAMVTAYRFQWHGDFNHVAENDGEVHSYFKITCRYLGPSWNGTVEDLATEAFWSNHNEHDVSRTLYAMGMLNSHFADEGGPDSRLGKEAIILSSKRQTENSRRAYVAFLTRDSWHSTGAVSADSETFPIWLLSND